MPPDLGTSFLAPAEVQPIADLDGALRSALGRPLGAPALDEALSPDATVLILVSDITRSGGTDKILPLLLAYLGEAGVARSSTTVLVSRGAHRKLTKEERDIIGPGGLRGVRIEEHDCDNGDKLSALLLTRSGTPVRTNVALKDADVVILLGPISFHYFAGFGGGRKLVLPGCTDRASITANHRLSLVEGDPVTLHDRCKAGNLDGNPVHEDMCETLEALHGVFAVNFFGDLDGNITFVNAGDPIQSHATACEAYRDVYLCETGELYDVMILSAGGFPYDINLLQSHKGLRHAAGALKPGAAVLYFAQCEEGIGSTSFESALKINKEEFLKTAHENYDLNNQAAVSLHDLTGRFEVGMVSTMNVDVLLSIGIKPCVNTEAFVAEALEKRGSNRVGVVANVSRLLLRGPGGTP